MMKWLLVVITTNINGLNVEIRSTHPTQATCVDAKKIVTAQPEKPTDFDRGLYCVKNYK